MSPRSDKYVADTLQKLPHPPASVSSYCSCAQKKRKKITGSKRLRVRGSGTLGTHWPRQRVSFHASFIHFITSLDQCEGVEEKPCYTETEREEPHSIFSSHGSALASAWSLHARITRLRGKCELSYERATSGDRRRTWFGVRDSWACGKTGRRHGECILCYTPFASNERKISPSHRWVPLLVCCSMRTFDICEFLHFNSKRNCLFQNIWFVSN